MSADQIPSPETKSSSPTPTPHSEKKAGRRKINIEFIEDKSRRHITFSKRKAGLMKKAYELSTLTGTQVLLLVASETGHVYTFATPKLQPLITKPEGKNLIQTCLNSPDAQQPQTPHPQQYPEANLMYPQTPETLEAVYEDDKKPDTKGYPINVQDMNFAGGYPSGMMGSTVGLYPPMHNLPIAANGARYLPAQYAPQGAPPTPSSTGQYANVPQSMSNVNVPMQSPVQNVQHSGLPHPHAQGYMWSSPAKGQQIMPLQQMQAPSPQQGSMNSQKLT